MSFKNATSGWWESAAKTIDLYTDRGRCVLIFAAVAAACVTIQSGTITFTKTSTFNVWCHYEYKSNQDTTKNAFSEFMFFQNKCAIS